MNFTKDDKTKIIDQIWKKLINAFNTHLNKKSLEKIKNPMDTFPINNNTYP